MSRHAQRGFSLVELLTIIAILGIMVACAMPSWLSIRRRAAIRSASAEIRSVFHQVRSRAIARARHSGIRFTRAGDEWQYAIYDDGDGDGIRNDDIDRNVDRMVSPPRFLFQQPHLVSIGLLPYTVRDPDGGLLPPSASPVRFNRSSICSFSRLGTATPGTIYLTDGNGSLYAARVYGATAKIRLLRYEPAIRKWQAR